MPYNMVLNQRWDQLRNQSINFSRYSQSNWKETVACRQCVSSPWQRNYIFSSINTVTYTVAR